MGRPPIMRLPLLLTRVAKWRGGEVTGREPDAVGADDDDGAKGCESRDPRALRHPAAHVARVVPQHLPSPLHPPNQPGPGRRGADLEGVSADVPRCAVGGEAQVRRLVGPDGNGFGQPLVGVRVVELPQRRGVDVLPDLLSPSSSLPPANSMLEQPGGIR